MRVRILGSAAGGGVPQWNCRCGNCTAARAGSAVVQPRTQSSLAVSADGSSWFLLNVSPDVRQQILAFPTLVAASTPSTTRGTNIAGCVLTDGELDHTTGLLLLREGSPIPVFCTEPVRRWLNRHLPVEPILTSFCQPMWMTLPLEAPLDLPLPDGTASGLRIKPFAVDDRAPRYVPEGESRAAGAVVGFEVEDLRARTRFVYAPCVSSIEPRLKQAARGASAILVDGTFWDDEEPRRSGIGSRTARAMGHVPVSGANGSLNWLAGLKVAHRAYIHINNTNPMLNRAGPEHRMVSNQGVRVSADGDELEL